MKFELKGTEERRPERVKMDVRVSHIAPPNPYTGTDMFQQRFRLEMRVFTDFWSNDAQLKMKERHALQMAHAHMFKDMIPLVEEIICDADDDDVRATAIRLKNMMIPET